ncbi:hypothetical protein LLG95_12955 [bacterium]|nr:hypothetical protein [bacterium]
MKKMQVTQTIEFEGIVVTCKLGPLAESRIPGIDDAITVNRNSDSAKRLARYCAGYGEPRYLRTRVRVEIFGPETKRPPKLKSSMHSRRADGMTRRHT